MIAAEFAGGFAAYQRCAPPATHAARHVPRCGPNAANSGPSAGQPRCIEP
jgi:hypothetical protein